MGLLLDQLGVLQTVDQLEFLSLHPCDLLLIKRLLRCFTSQTLLLLRLNSRLLFHEVHLTTTLRFHLLLLDHHLELSGLLFLLDFLSVEGLFGLLFIYFRIEGFLLRAVRRHRFVHVHALLDFLLHHHVLALFHLLLLENLALTFELLLLEFHVAATLAYDVSCAFSRLIDLANRLQNVYSWFWLTFDSSCFRSPIRLQRSFRSSSARLRAIFAATNFLCKVASSSSSYGVRSNSSGSCIASVAILN